MTYIVVLDPRAIQDLQDAINHYDKRQPGLGEKFEKTLNKYLITLQKSPFFQIRYDDVHCLPLKKFPYMVHFTVDDKNRLITVRAVFHTARTPKTWKSRK